MDVLQLIKLDHSMVRDLCQQLDSANRANKTKNLALIDAWSRVVGVENELLFPEVIVSYSKISPYIENCQSRTTKITRNLKSLSAKSDSECTDLQPVISAIVEYLSEIEDRLMPIFRKHLSTQSREDLGQLYVDLVDDLAIEVSEGKSKKVAQKKRA